MIVKFIRALPVFFILAGVASAQQPAEQLVVRGDVRQARQWSVSDLKERFGKDVQTVRFTPAHGNEQISATGIPLVSLVLASQPDVHETPKHHDLTFLVILEARDQYRVFFSLAELLPAIGGAQAWLLFDVNGKALEGKEAPLRLVVLSDKTHDRNIYGITSITLVDGTKLARSLFPR